MVACAWASSRIGRRLRCGRRSIAAGERRPARRPLCAKGVHGLSWCRDSHLPSHVGRVGAASQKRTPSRGLSAGRRGCCSQKMGRAGHRRGAWARGLAATGLGGQGSGTVPNPAAPTRLAGGPARRRRPPGAAGADVPMSFPVCAGRHRRSEHGNVTVSGRFRPLCDRHRVAKPRNLGRSRRRPAEISWRAQGRAFVCAGDRARRTVVHIMTANPDASCCSGRAAVLRGPRAVARRASCCAGPASERSAPDWPVLLGASATARAPSNTSAGPTPRARLAQQLARRATPRHAPERSLARRNSSAGPAPRARPAQQLAHVLLLGPVVPTCSRSGGHTRGGVAA
jgi:hypothetical protein